jgi:hypothetical protein
MEAAAFSEAHPPEAQVAAVHRGEAQGAVDDLPRELGREYARGDGTRSTTGTEACG